MKGIIGIALIILGFASAHAASILFEFSGRFGDCQAPCDDANLATLSQQEYSGSLVISASATSQEPDGQNRPFSDDMVWSYYELTGPQAQLNFDTVGTEFDVITGAPISTIVSFCGTLSCASNRNFVWFQFIDDTYTFTFNFGTLSDVADRSIHIPDVSGYAAFSYMGFGIHRNSDFTDIQTNDLSPTETEMDISISYTASPTVQVPLSSSVNSILGILLATYALFVTGKGPLKFSDEPLSIPSRAVMRR